MYQLSVAEGKELKEEQLAERVSPVLYEGRVPLITGPSSGKSEIILKFFKLFQQKNCF